MELKQKILRCTLEISTLPKLTVGSPWVGAWLPLASAQANKPTMMQVAPTARCAQLPRQPRANREGKSAAKAAARKALHTPPYRVGSRFSESSTFSVRTAISRPASRAFTFRLDALTPGAWLSSRHRVIVDNSGRAESEQGYSIRQKGRCVAHVPLLQVLVRYRKLDLLVHLKLMRWPLRFWTRL